MKSFDVDTKATESEAPKEDTTYLLDEVNRLGHSLYALFSPNCRNVAAENLPDAVRHTVWMEDQDTSHKGASIHRKEVILRAEVDTGSSDFDRYYCDISSKREHTSSIRQKQYAVEKETGRLIETFEKHALGETRTQYTPVNMESDALCASVRDVMATREKLALDASVNITILDAYDAVSQSKDGTDEYRRNQCRVIRFGIEPPAKKYSIAENPTHGYHSVPEVTLVQENGQEHLYVFKGRHTKD